MEPRTYSLKPRAIQGHVPAIIMFNGRSIDSPRIRCCNLLALPAVAAVGRLMVVKGAEYGAERPPFQHPPSVEPWRQSYGADTPAKGERYIPMARAPLDFIKRKFMPLLECQILQTSNDEAGSGRACGYGIRHWKKFYKV